MTTQLIEAVCRLDDVKQNRFTALKEIYLLYQNSSFDLGLIFSCISNHKFPPFCKALLIQLTAKAVKNQISEKESFLNFIKKYYRENKKNCPEIVVESILFLHSLLDRTHLLTFHFENKRLMGLRTRLLFVNDEIATSFKLPARDILAGRRVISLERLCKNLITMANLEYFNQVKDFIEFSCKFPFINNIDFICSWSGLKDETLLKDLLGSSIFVGDENFIVYSPSERVKSDKFVFDIKWQEELIELIAEQRDTLEKKRIFEQFTDTFLKMSNLFKDTAIIVIGFQGQQKFNQNSQEILGEYQSKPNYILELAQRILQNGTEPLQLEINGIALEATISPLVVENQEIGQLMVLKDITELQINKMFSAHDFKNAFNSVITTFKILKESTALETDEVECLKSGENSIYKLKEKFDEIISFKSNKINVENDLDLIEITNRTIISFGNLARSKNINLNFPQVADTILIDGDEAKLGRIIENLLGNAIKYSPANSTVLIFITQDEKQCKISISDQGFGIEDEFADKIFKIGTRQERDRQKIEGSGLGLAIVKKFTNLHNGEISFTHNDNGGTTFTVTLPNRQKV